MSRHQAFSDKAEMISFEGWWEAECLPVHRNGRKDLSRPTSLAPHLSTEELGRRYKAASDGIERSHLQIIWLLSQGHAAKSVAAVTGYSRSWISEITWRYNDHGVEGLGDRRH